MEACDMNFVLREFLQDVIAFPQPLPTLPAALTGLTLRNPGLNRVNCEIAPPAGFVFDP